MNEEKTINGIISGSIGCTILGKAVLAAESTDAAAADSDEEEETEETEAEDKDTTAKKKENLKTVGRERRMVSIAFKLRNANL